MFATTCVFGINDGARYGWLERVAGGPLTG